MKEMSLLDNVENLFPDIDLSQVTIVACQHILDTNYTLLRKLVKIGAKPKNIFLIGKNYSTNIPTMNAIKNEGISVHSSSAVFSNKKSFDFQFKENIEDFISKIQLNRIKNLIILDDGADLINAFNRLNLKKLKIVGIEQTSSGYHSVKKLKLKFPVINVARSHAKLTYESPFIAENVVEKIKLKLSKYKFNKSKILVIGSGKIGKEIFNQIQIKLNPKISTLLEFKENTSENELFQIVSNYDIIIGCTGKSILNLNKIDNNQRQFFISASSSDREFNAHQFRKNINTSSKCHDDIIYKKITLLNNGFPINFDGKKESVPAEKIQLTRALMFSAICQSQIFNYKNEIIPLGKEIQKDIIGYFKKIKNSPSEEFILNRNLYEKGRITKYQYFKRMHQYNKLFFEYQKIMKNNLKEIKINQRGASLSLEKPEIEFLTDQSHRSAVFELINFKKYEENELKMIEKLIKKEGVIVDAGSHIGWYSAILAKKYPGSIVHSFEPILNTFNYLIENIKNNKLINIIPHNFALGEKHCNKYFHYFSSGSVLSSLKNIIKNPNSKKIKCDIKTLDSMNLKNVEFMKIDVEGSEFKVLKGALNTLKQSLPILFIELYQPWSEQFGFTPNEVILFLKQFGYECFATNDGLTLIKISNISRRTPFENYFFLHKNKHLDMISKYRIKEQGSTPGF